MLGVALGLWTALGCASAGAAAREGGGARLEAPDEPQTRREQRRERKEERKRTLTEKMAGRATEGAVEQAIDTLDSPETRERVSRIIASPEMQAAARDITAAVVAGVFQGVDLARARGQVPGVPDDLGKTIGRSINRDISPAVGRLVHTTVDSAFEAALSEENTGRAEALVHRIGAGVTTGLANAVRDELGPALAVTIERDILPALGRGLQHADMQAAIVKSIASLGIGAAKGTQAGLAEANVQGGPGSRVGGTLAVGMVAVIAAAVAFGVLFIVMTVLLVRANRRQRELMEQSRRREERFLAVLEGRADTHGEPITSSGPILTG